MLVVCRLHIKFDCRAQGPRWKLSSRFSYGDVEIRPTGPIAQLHWRAGGSTLTPARQKDRSSDILAISPFRDIVRIMIGEPAAYDTLAARRRPVLRMSTEMHGYTENHIAIHGETGGQGRPVPVRDGRISKPAPEATKLKSRSGLLPSCCLSIDRCSFLGNGQTRGGGLAPANDQFLSRPIRPIILLQL